MLIQFLAGAAGGVGRGDVPGLRRVPCCPGRSPPCLSPAAGTPCQAGSGRRCDRSELLCGLGVSCGSA